MDYRVEAVVIGAGVVGLAIGRAMALRGLETVVLEKADRIGAETSSRNSEVIHAGIYYPPGSLKARLCVRGKELLYQYLTERTLPYSRCGKLIVATAVADRRRLSAIAQQGSRCGVHDLRFVPAGEIADLEPEVEAACGLLSPSTGIFDSHQFMLSLQGDLEAAGGNLILATPVTGGRLARRGDHVLETGGDDPTVLVCRLLVNATGLHARATWLALNDAHCATGVPEQYFAKGHYYSYPGTPPFNRLIYPLPDKDGLGVHATLDLMGQVRFGPDVKWVEGIDYHFDESNRESFVEAVRAYYPGLEADRLQPGYTGIRPKILGPGLTGGDFLLLTEQEHGFTGFYSLHGIESPGLTASLAIAEEVLARIG